ncbi:hypothetical protein ACFVT2_21680 [Streptomyces sp. NPDC058000]|uniref:hypothetical protein n=1 Tax=Streptomyces sp. NPDC058000 TaxID=3346299 RepID=UPI0036E05106
MFFVVLDPAEDDALQVSEVDDVGMGTEGVDALVHVVLDLGVRQVDAGPVQS